MGGCLPLKFNCFDDPVCPAGTSGFAGIIGHSAYSISRIRAWRSPVGSG